MSSELSILALYGLVCALVIVVHVLTAMGQVGLPMLATARDEMPKLEGLAGRFERAQKNAIYALALFAPAILILSAKGGFTPTTLLAAQVFLIARILHVILYAAGTPWLRTGVWTVGFIATVWLYYLAL